MPTTDSSADGIAVFGGSFDPVHVGHLWMAEAALSSLPVDHVRWFPAAVSPLKPGGPVATNEQRLQMVRLAVGGQDGHVIDTWELDRDEISYTVDTLGDLRQRFPGRELFLVIGADSLASFAAWNRPEEILKRCTLAVIARGGASPPDYSVLEPYASPDQIDKIRGHEIAMPVIEISSSGLRADVAAAQSIRFRTPHAVEAFIRAEKLYSNPS